MTERLPKGMETRLQQECDALSAAIAADRKPKDTPGQKMAEALTAGHSQACEKVISEK